MAGLFDDPYAMMNIGGLLMAAGAPSLDPGAGQRALGTGLQSLMAQQRQRQVQQKAAELAAQRHKDLFGIQKGRLALAEQKARREEDMRRAMMAYYGGAPQSATPNVAPHGDLAGGYQQPAQQPTKDNRLAMFAAAGATPSSLLSAEVGIERNDRLRAQNEVLADYRTDSLAERANSRGQRAVGDPKLYEDLNTNEIVEAYWDKAKQKHINTKTGKPLGDNYRRVTTTQLERDRLPATEYHKARRKMFETGRSLRVMRNYAGNVAGTREGLLAAYDKLAAKLNTAFGKDISPEEWNNLVSSGKLQGLIGKFRIPIVGGGVMTEQDAVRIVTRLGGDVSALRNKAVVSEALSSMYREMIDEYNFDREVVESQARFYKSARNIPDIGVNADDIDKIMFGELPKGVTPEVVDATAKKYGWTRATAWRKIRRDAGMSD